MLQASNQGSHLGATSGKEQDGELLLHEETGDRSQQGTGSECSPPPAGQPHRDVHQCKLQRIQIHQWRDKLAYKLELNGLFAHNINIYLLQPQLKSAGRKRWHNLNSLPLTQKHYPSLFSSMSWCMEGARRQTVQVGRVTQEMLFYESLHLHLKWLCCSSMTLHRTKNKQTKNFTLI